MKYFTSLASSLALSTLMTPLFANALSFQQAIGLFNVFVGLMLTAAILLFGAGFIVWACRLGTWPTYRTEAIKIMEWSVVILFVLVVLLAIVQFFQNHPIAATYVISTIVLLLIAWGVIYALANQEPKKEEH